MPPVTPRLSPQMSSISTPIPNITILHYFTNPNILAQNGVALKGEIAQTTNVTSVNECCAEASKFSKSRNERVMWAFANTTCSIYDHVWGKQPGKATVGITGSQPPPGPEVTPSHRPLILSSLHHRHHLLLLRYPPAIIGRV